MDEYERCVCIGSRLEVIHSVFMVRAPILKLRMSILQSVAGYDTVTKIGLYVLAFVAEKLFLVLSRA